MRLFECEDHLKKMRGFYHDEGVIKVIVGVCRCGKPCLRRNSAGTSSREAFPKHSTIPRWPNMLRLLRGAFDHMKYVPA